jgi:hypothetical protein
METSVKKKRICDLCGKVINYEVITDDGTDWCGHQRGQSSSRTIGYECDCTQYKRMCRNCEHYNSPYCNNKETIALYQKKYEDEIFAIDISELRIKDATKKCKYWELARKVAEELFK